MTDDRGFMLDPHYAEQLRENFAYEHLYSPQYGDGDCHDDDDDYDEDYHDDYEDEE